VRYPHTGYRIRNSRQNKKYNILQGNNQTVERTNNALAVMPYVNPVQKAFLTTKGTKKHENFEDYNHHTNTTLKKFVLFRAFRG